MHAHRPTPIYATQEIVVAHDHLIFFTPPYHPELQPIELVWAFGKNKIAHAPATNMNDLKDKIEAHSDAVSSKLWTSVYRKVQRQEDHFIDADHLDVETSEESSIDVYNSTSSSDEHDDFLV